jgi:hypothetical protein
MRVKLVKRFLFVVLVFLLALAATTHAAMTSGSYSIPASGIGVTGGSSSSPSYTGVAVVGAPATGRTSSPSYTSIAGTGIIIITTSATAPVISNLRVDGTPVINGDFVKSSGILTATITADAASSLDLNVSSIEVDGTATTFAALSGGSTYDATTKVLTCQLNLTANGNHTIRIHAADVGAQSATATLTVKLDTGDLKAVAVYAYPNPYNPSAAGGTNARIGYQLNKDANTAIYLFNAVGELIYKREYTTGTQGGKTGYNEVTWDGKSDFGSIVGNDIYFLRVVSDGKPVGKTKIAVVK